MKLHLNKENQRGYKNDFQKNIYYSRISSGTTSAVKKGAPNARKIHSVENGSYNKLPFNKILSLNINCSVFEDKASNENIEKNDKVL